MFGALAGGTLAFPFFWTVDTREWICMAIAVTGGGVVTEQASAAEPIENTPVSLIQLSNYNAQPIFGSKNSVSQRALRIRRRRYALQHLEVTAGRDGLGLRISRVLAVADASNCASRSSSLGQHSR